MNYFLLAAVAATVALGLFSVVIVIIILLISSQWMMLAESNRIEVLTIMDVAFKIYSLR